MLTHFIVSSDIGQARRFYAGVLGGEVLREGEPSIVALANSWIIINAGGAPTDDKPTVTLETPRDPDHVSSFLNIRVADIRPGQRNPTARQRMEPRRQVTGITRHSSCHCTGPVPARLVVAT